MANFFPRFTNVLPLQIAVCIAALGVGVAAAFTYYATPKSTRVGYQPDQPIPFSHKIHVDQLGLDCRYCHSFVEYSGHSNVPSSNTCYNCHAHVKTDSNLLEPLRQSVATGKPIEWTRIHVSPDYVYFNHSAHVNRGISCQSCHGEVNKMDVVYQAESHSMGWCLDCHRAPEKHLRPNAEVTNMEYDPVEYITKHGIRNEEGDLMDADEFGLHLREKWNVQPKESCSTCHR